MSPCHPFRPVPGQCGPNRRGPLPAPPFDPRDYWATRKCVSQLSASFEKKLDRADVVDPGAATEAGKAADAKSTYEELSRILAKLAKKADKATTLAGYGITDAATKAELAAKADLVDGKVPAFQLPSYIDDVLEYDTISAFPDTGESNKIYVAKDANKTYRWSGTQYVEISPLPVLDDTVTEESPNGVKSSGIWSWVKSLLPHWLTRDYTEPATVASVANKRDKDDRAVYSRTFTGHESWFHSDGREFVYVSDGLWKSPFSDVPEFYFFIRFNPELQYGENAGGGDQVLWHDYDGQISEHPDRVDLGRGLGSIHRTADGTVDEKTNQRLAAVATDDASKPSNGDLVKYDAANDRFVKAVAGTDYIPFIQDLNDNKTSVTIGIRKSGKSIGPYSLANGHNVTASGYASHAEGAGTTASDDYSHAEGTGTTASGVFSHAEGEGTTASGYASHAEGVDTTASGDYSHAEGTKARTLADDRYAYAWNGDEDRVIQYSSHGPGTFNINPVGGLNGFYIGDQTLTQVINAVIAERLSTVDPDNASVYDLIKALKGE